MRTIIPIIATIAILALAACSRRSGDKAERKADIIRLDMRSDSLAEYATCLEEEGQAVRLATRSVGRFDEVFNDSNHRHWTAAEPIGITPLSDLRSHWQLRRPIVKIASCRDFYLEPLTHSQPFLVEEAAETLHEIGRRFRDSLEARGGGDYRIRVTSVLRTPANVRRLRRANGNAVDSSVHKLGTTFDISYNSFAADSHETPRSAVQLKALLAEVLYAMREEGKILIKYEKKQPCFHVSAIERQ